MQRQANTFLTLHSALFTPHTPHFTLALYLNSSHLSSSHLISCLPICQLSSSRLFSCHLSAAQPVSCLNSSRLFCTSESLRHRCIYTEESYKILCTTKLAQSTFQYYFALQSWQKYFPILLCTTKLAQSISQYHFELQSLHKLLPSTTLYYKTCTNYFPVLLCTTKLAQNTFQ